MEQETTYYRFLSEVRAFLSKLMKDPIRAKVSAYLKDRDITRTKLIKELMNRGVLVRNEKILTPDKTGEKDVKYSVKYNVVKKNFETKVKRIYTKFFEKNEPEKVNECEGGDGGAMGGGELGGTSSASVGAGTTRGDVGYDVVFGPMIARPGYNAQRDKKKKTPKDILGKTIQAEKKMPKRIFITEEQFRKLIGEEAAGVTATSTVGSMGNYTAQGLELKTSDGKEDPCAKAGKIKVKMIMDK